MLLHQTANRLANVFNKYCKDPQSAAAEAEEVIDELYLALGGCELCAGAGYILIGDNYDYCECKRGKSLEKFVENR